MRGIDVRCVTSLEPTDTRTRSELSRRAKLIVQHVLCSGAGLSQVDHRHAAVLGQLARG
jgi:hypothetical protein